MLPSNFFTVMSMPLAANATYGAPLGLSAKLKAVPPRGAPKLDHRLSANVSKVARPVALLTTMCGWSLVSTAMEHQLETSSPAVPKFDQLPACSFWTITTVPSLTAQYSAPEESVAMLEEDAGLGLLASATQQDPSKHGHVADRVAIAIHSDVGRAAGGDGEAGSIGVCPCSAE